MTTKVCTKCFQEKPIDEFPLRSRFTGRRHSHCKECVAKISGQWYENNRDRQRENAKRHRVVYRQTAREYIWDYLLNHPCISCGERDPCVLEFHHARGKKETDVSSLVGRGSSLEALKREIEKCDVLCANCHRKLTAKERSWFKR